MTTTDATIDNGTGILGYYYVSMPFFKHARMKCAGRCPNQAHMDFYLPYFREHGPSVVSNAKNGPFKVVIVPFSLGDQIDTPAGTK